MCLHGVVGDLLTNSLIVPRFSLSVKVKGSVFASLRCCKVNSPLGLISTLIPSGCTTCTFSLLICLHCCLTKFTFILLTGCGGRDGAKTYTNTVVCIFSTCTVCVALERPSFVGPLVCFPLVVLNNRVVFSNGHPCLFVVSIYLTTMDNFCFFCIVSVFAVLCIFLEVFFTCPGSGLLGNFFRTLFGFKNSCLLKVVVTTIALLPVVVAILFSGENSIRRTLGPFCTNRCCGRFVNTFVKCIRLSYGICVNFATTKTTTVILLFVRGGGRNFLGTTFVATALLVVFPVYDGIVGKFSCIYGH